MEATCGERLCGRTVQNSTLMEALVFHQTLSTPKANYCGRYPSGTPRGRTQKIHIFPKDPIMRTSYNTSPFHTSEFLKSILLQYQIPECGMIAAEFLKITSSGKWRGFRLSPPEGSSTQRYSSSITCNMGK